MLHCPFKTKVSFIDKRTSLLNRYPPQPQHSSQLL